MSDYQDQGDATPRVEPDGGSIAHLKVGAVIRDLIKYAVVAFPVEGMNPRQPIPSFTSGSIEHTLKQLGQEFEVDQRTVHGRKSDQPVHIKIRNLDNFEESKLVEQSPLLAQQQVDIDFLEEFQKEIKQDAQLQVEINDLIQLNDGRNFEIFLQLLDNWIALLEPKHQSRLMQLLQQ